MPYDLDILANTQFEYCVRCYAPEGKYEDFPCSLVMRDGNVNPYEQMKLPHHGRKAISSDA